MTRASPLQAQLLRSVRQQSSSPLQGWTTASLAAALDGVTPAPPPDWPARSTSPGASRQGTPATSSRPSTTTHAHRQAGAGASAGLAIALQASDIMLLSVALDREDQALAARASGGGPLSSSRLATPGTLATRQGASTAGDAAAPLSHVFSAADLTARLSGPADDAGGRPRSSAVVAAPLQAQRSVGSAAWQGAQPPHARSRSAARQPHLHHRPLSRAGAGDGPGVAGTGPLAVAAGMAVQGATLGGGRGGREASASPLRRKEDEGGHDGAAQRLRSAGVLRLGPPQQHLAAHAAATVVAVGAPEGKQPGATAGVPGALPMLVKPLRGVGSGGHLLQARASAAAAGAAGAAAPQQQGLIGSSRPVSRAAPSSWGADQLQRGDLL